MTEPGRDEVLAWMARTGRTSAEAIDHFWPGSVGKDRTRIGARIRKWGQLAREAGHPAAPPRQVSPSAADRDDDEESDERPARPPADLATTRLEQIPFLEWQLSELIADLKWARDMCRLHDAASLDRRVSEVRAELVLARAQGGRSVDLERSPAAVADEVLRRDKHLRELAARAAERDL